MVDILAESAHSLDLPEMSPKEVEDEFSASADVQIHPELRTSFIPFVTPGITIMARKIRDAIDFFRLPNPSDYNSLE